MPPSSSSLSSHSSVFNASPSSASATASPPPSSSSFDHEDDDDLEIDEWDPDKSSFLVHAISGSLAGLAEHTLVFPFDLWKTFRQADVGQQSLSVLVREQGLSRLWRGTSTMLLGSVPAHAGYFTIYEFGKVQFGANGSEHAPLAAGLSGALATIFHDVIMTPMDVVKQRLQLGFHTGVVDAFRSIVATQGPQGLYRSFPVALAMNIPFASLNVAANESFKRVINPSGEHRVHLSLLCGALAGGLAGALTTPLDVVRTRIQTQSLHPSQHKAPNPNARASIFASRRLVGPLAASSTASIQRTSAAFGAARAKYTSPMRCPLPIALWAISPGSSTWVRPSSPPPSPPPKIMPPGIVDTVRTLWRKDGAKGFFRGVEQRVLVQAPAVAISWAAYETAKDALVNHL